MKLLLIIAAAVLVGILPDLPRKRRKAKKPPPANCAPLVLNQIAENEKRRKAALKRKQAEIDVRHLGELKRVLYDKLADYQAAADEDGKSPAEYERLQNKIMAAKNKIAAAEKKLAAAEYVIKYGG